MHVRMPVLKYYHRRKWTFRLKFKSSTNLFSFLFTKISLGKTEIYFLAVERK